MNAHSTRRCLLAFIAAYWLGLAVIWLTPAAIIIHLMLSVAATAVLLVLLTVTIALSIRHGVREFEKVSDAAPTPEGNGLLSEPNN